MNRCLPVFLTTLIVASALGAAPATANTLSATNTLDHGVGSLRDAIASAAPGDTIVVNAAGTIALTDGGPLVVEQNLTIVGPGAAVLTIHGGNASQIFTIAGAAAVSISGVTIAGGHADYFGGAILNGGRLTLTDCVLSGNSAGFFGGAIYNTGSLTITGGGLSNNFAEFRAGAIYSETGSTLTLDHTTLSGNSSSVGGAIDNHDGTLTIVASTLSGNFTTGAHGGAGGAIHSGGLGGTIAISSSTFAANVGAWEGGAIYVGSGVLTIDTTTIADNSSPCNFGGCSGGGGIYSHSSTVSIANSTLSNNTSAQGGSVTSLYGTTTVKNSIVAKGAAGSNCYTYTAIEIASAGNNLSDDDSCLTFFAAAGDRNGVAAGLSPDGLRDNGGATATIALVAASPAVDAVPLDACVDRDGHPIADQRGVARPSGSACDAGAFELILHPTSLTSIAPAPSSLAVGSAGPVMFSATLTRQEDGTPIAGAAIAWSVDGSIVATSITGANGVATSAYNPSLLSDGDHVVQAFCARQTVGGVTFDVSSSAVESFHLQRSSYAAQVQPPVRADGTSVFKGRGVVPVKFTATFGGAATCDLPAASIGLVQTGGSVVGPVTAVASAGSSDSGTAFRIDSCQYIFNLSTAPLGPGTYDVRILIGGAIAGRATFGLQ